jgi:hypothetical protein
MGQTVGQHGVAAFTNPSNGDPLNATVVKANDNTVRSAYVDHDNDGGIHLQSSTLATRPVAGSAGRKWLTTDTGSVKLWFDTGSAWEEISYLNSSSNLNASNLSSGTVPDARFPSVLPAVSGANLTNIPAGAAGTLTGTTLASNVVTSSLTSLGTLTALTVGGTTKIQQVLETGTFSATAATGTINYDALTQAVLYYTSDASANWTVNFRGSSGTSLNTMMTTGQTLTVTFAVTQGTTAYYASAHQIDGTSVTPKWQGGSAPTAGNASSVDIYTYTIAKTGNAAFTVFASQTRFA